MALDFTGSPRNIFRYERQAIAWSRIDATAAVCKEGHEERARAVFEIPGRGRHPALERKNLLGLQCGERLLRNDQLRRAHSDFLGCRATWSKDRDSRRLCGQRPGSALRALRRMPSSYLRIRPRCNHLFSRRQGSQASSYHRTASGRVPSPVNPTPASTQTFRAIDVIRKKRDGGELSQHEIESAGERLHPRRYSRLSGLSLADGGCIAGHDSARDRRADGCNAAIGRGARPLHNSRTRK